DGTRLKRDYLTAYGIPSQVEHRNQRRNMGRASESRRAQPLAFKILAFTEVPLRHERKRRGVAEVQEKRQLLAAGNQIDERGWRVGSHLDLAGSEHLGDQRATADQDQLHIEAVVIEKLFILRQPEWRHMGRWRGKRNAHALKLLCSCGLKGC